MPVAAPGAVDTAEDDGAALSGVIVNAMKLFMTDKFGDEAICSVLRDPACSVTRQHVDAFYQHVSMRALLPRSPFDKVVSELVEHFRQDREAFMFEFGQFLLTWMAQHTGFERSIHLVAGTIVDFVRSLNKFILQMLAAMGNIQAMMPHVSVQDEQPESFVLVLLGCSAPGSSHVIMGILDRIATQVFATQIRFQRLDDRGPNCQAFAVTCSSPSCSRLMQHSSRDSSSHTASSMMGLDPDSFKTIFPFRKCSPIRLRLTFATAVDIWKHHITPDLRPGS